MVGVATNKKGRTNDVDPVAVVAAIATRFGRGLSLSTHFIPSHIGYIGPWQQWH